jgi:hypothetical protein
MADVARFRIPYAGSVLNVSISANLAAATAPLFSSFGDDLTLWRDGNAAHWSYDGQTVIVEQQPDSSMTASFVDAPANDEVSQTPVTAIYRRLGSRSYHLTEDSCKAMVADMIAFFSGEREPLFAFVGANSLDA